jgi:CheY-like chemotaxis protein
LPPQDIEQLFEPFVQSEAMIDRSTGGLGLGLALVRKIVQLHGGEVHATSEGPDRGSEFVVRLPAVQEEHPSGVQSVPRRVPGGRLRVLVVEDTPDVRDSLRDVLELVGHEVHTAASGTEGLERALDITPDVVLLDIGLPGLSGYEVAERICAAANGGPRPFLVALTGYGQPEDRRRALASGFNAHLVKPVDIEVLGRLLSNTFPPTSAELDGPRHEAS